MKLDSSGSHMENVPSPTTTCSCRKKANRKEKRRHNENDTDAEVCALFEFGAVYVAGEHMRISPGKRIDATQ